MNPAAMPFGLGRPGIAYARNPYPALARLRDTAPRYYSPERDAWFISGRADNAALLRDDRLEITRSSSLRTGRTVSCLGGAAVAGVVRVVRGATDAHRFHRDRKVHGSVDRAPRRRSCSDGGARPPHSGDGVVAGRTFG